MKLPRTFYQKDTITVAKSLLGKLLVTNINNQIAGGIINEVEAYLGIEDKAAHSYGGKRTNRTEVLYNDGGIVYVYIVYGLYHGLNIVTRDKENPDAVLIRSIKPTIGIEYIKERRKNAKEKDLTNGPGKLCLALGIDRNLNGEDLNGNKIWIEESDIKIPKIKSSKRIGIDYAQNYKDKLWRFTLLNKI